MKRPSDKMLLVSANAMLFHRPGVLADFERETIQEAHRRVIRDGGVMSVAERLVVEDALAAMRSAPRQDLLPSGMAA